MAVHDEECIAAVLVAAISTATGTGASIFAAVPQHEAEAVVGIRVSRVGQDGLAEAVLVARVAAFPLGKQSRHGLRSLA